VTKNKKEPSYKKRDWDKRGLPNEEKRGRRGQRKKGRRGRKGASA